MKKIIPLLIAIIAIATVAWAGELEYKIVDGKFVTSEGEIPKGCFGQLMTELNGDNVIASIFINRANLRGCITANDPYPGGNEEEISYEINQKLKDNIFRITVCEVIHGSMGRSCDKIIVKFFGRKYTLQDNTQKEVLALEKIGEWK